MPPVVFNGAASSLANAEGSFFLATGLWPLVHLRSFEAVTGPKADDWLVKTVGLLLGAIGATLVTAKRRPAPWLAVLGAAAPAALAAIDVVYVAKKRISKVYLLDAAIQLAFVVAWAAVSRKAVSAGRGRRARRRRASASAGSSPRG